MIYSIHVLQRIMLVSPKTQPNSMERGLFSMMRVGNVQFSHPGKQPIQGQEMSTRKVIFRLVKGEEQ